MFCVGPNIVVCKPTPRQFPLGPPPGLQPASVGFDQFHYLVKRPMGSIVDDMQLVVRFALGKINTGMMVEFMDEIAPLTLAKSLTILARRCR